MRQRTLSEEPIACLETQRHELTWVLRGRISKSGRISGGLIESRG